MDTKLIFTPAPWHVVEFAGNFELMDEPYYQAKKINDADFVGYEVAQQNAMLASLAPKMFGMLNKFIYNAGVSNHVDYNLIEEAKLLINNLGFIDCTHEDGGVTDEGWECSDCTKIIT